MMGRLSVMKINEMRDLPEFAKADLPECEAPGRVVWCGGMHVEEPDN